MYNSTMVSFDISQCSIHSSCYLVQPLMPTSVPNTPYRRLAAPGVWVVLRISLQEKAGGLHLSSIGHERSTPPTPSNTTNEVLSCSGSSSTFSNWIEYAYFYHFLTNLCLSVCLYTPTKSRRTSRHWGSIQSAKICLPHMRKRESGKGKERYPV